MCMLIHIPKSGNVVDSFWSAEKMFVAIKSDRNFQQRNKNVQETIFRQVWFAFKIHKKLKMTGKNNERIRWVFTVLLRRVWPASRTVRITTTSDRSLSMWWWEINKQLKKIYFNHFKRFASLTHQWQWKAGCNMKGLKTWTDRKSLRQKTARIVQVAESKMRKIASFAPQCLDMLLISTKAKLGVGKVAKGFEQLSQLFHTTASTVTSAFGRSLLDLYLLGW